MNPVFLKIVEIILLMMYALLDDKNGRKEKNWIISIFCKFCQPTPERRILIVFVNHTILVLLVYPIFILQLSNLAVQEK